MDLAVAALACDQTRILTFQWSYSESEHLFSFLNITRQPPRDLARLLVERHQLRRLQQDPDLVPAAVRVPAGQDGRDQGRDRDAAGQQHRAVGDRDRRVDAARPDCMMPYVLAGSASGKIRAGRLLDFGSNKRDNNQMLVSIGQAMGDNLTSFGDASGATGPLPGLGLAAPLAAACCVRRAGPTLAIRWRWRRSTSARCCKRSSRLWASRRSPCTNSASPSRRDCRPHACRDCRPSAG